MRRGDFGRGGHSGGGVVDPADQDAQFLDGVVIEVGDGAGDVLAHRRGNRQVTVGQVAQFVHQSQNRVLIVAVHLFRRLALALRSSARRSVSSRGRRGRAWPEQGHRTSTIRAAMYMPRVDDPAGNRRPGRRSLSEVVASRKMREPATWRAPGVAYCPGCFHGTLVILNAVSRAANFLSFRRRWPVETRASLPFWSPVGMSRKALVSAAGKPLPD